MKAAFSDDWMHLFMLACYMIASGDPLMYCEDWLCGTESYPVGKVHSRSVVCSYASDLSSGMHSSVLGIQVAAKTIFSR